MIRGGLVTLSVRDVPHAVRFYVETLGMKLVDEDASRSIVDAGEGFRIALVAFSAASGTNEPLGLYAKVPMAEAIAIYENRGVTFDVKTDGPTTRAHFRDPDGNALFLLQEK